MKAQEVLSIITEIASEDIQKGSILKTYPELDPYFEKGMYVEKVTQSCLENGKCIITFVFRYYNPSQSKAS